MIDIQVIAFITFISTVLEATGYDRAGAGQAEQDRDRDRIREDCRSQRQGSALVPYRSLQFAGAQLSQGRSLVFLVGEGESLELIGEEAFRVLGPRPASAISVR